MGDEFNISPDDEPRVPRNLGSLLLSEISSLTNEQALPGDYVTAKDTNQVFMCVGTLGDELQWRSIIMQVEG